MNGTKYSIFPSSNRPKPLTELAYAFGDSNLIEMTRESKRHLIDILTQWQAFKVKQQKGYFGLEDAFYSYEHFNDLSNQVEQAIVSLSGLSDDDCFHLMVALALQIKHGIYQS